MVQEKNTGSFMRYVAALALLILLSILAIFHFLIVTKVFQFAFIWGGKIKNTSQMILVETVSISINLIMISVVAISAGIIKSKIPSILIKIALRFMGFLFIVNTIGNFNSENQFEKTIFTPMTLVFSILCFILIISKK